jgi:hypothetical protein
MARTLEIVWQDDVDSLFQLYRRESDPELRTRWHALWLLRQGSTPTAAAQLPAAATIRSTLSMMVICEGC